MTFPHPVPVEYFEAAILDGLSLRMYDREPLLLGWKAAPYCLSLLRNYRRCRHGGYAVIICGLFVVVAEVLVAQDAYDWSRELSSAKHATTSSRPIPIPH